jgi:azurin
MTPVIGRQAGTGHAVEARIIIQGVMFMRRLGLVLFVLFAAASALPAQAPRTIEIVATDDMKWTVSKITAKPGEMIRIKLTSKGAIPKVAMAHNFVLLAAGTDAQKFIDAGAADRATDFIAPAMKAKVLAATRFAGPGETVYVNFKAPAKAGNYTYLCTFSGHFQAGMKGVLTVK